MACGPEWELADFGQVHEFNEKFGEVKRLNVEY